MVMCGLLTSCPVSCSLAQTLLNFNSHRRLLLTGTPLQVGSLLSSRVMSPPAGTDRGTVPCGAVSHRPRLVINQNDLMELWSLMHFLMPHVFRSRKEFSYWFSNPLNNMVEGKSKTTASNWRPILTVLLYLVHAC